MLLDPAAHKFLNFKQAHERDTPTQITAVKAEIKSQLRLPGIAVEFREFVYSPSVVKNRLYDHLKTRFSVDSVKPF